MSEQSTHADGAPPPPDVPEPTLAEKARTLTVQGGQSTLSTLSRKHPGYPFGSLMPYGLTSAGEPTFLISSMAMHTRNLLDNPHATLLITQDADSSNPLGAGRISLMGDVEPQEGKAAESELAESYLERNPSAQNWLHFGDFHFFQMRLVDVYFVGGFGVMGWISAEEFRAAQPDPLVHVANGIIQHMNQDHRDAMALLAKHYSGLTAEDAEMTSVDRLGFNLRVQTSEGMKGARIAYPSPIGLGDDVRQVFVQMVETARR